MIDPSTNMKAMNIHPSSRNPSAYDLDGLLPLPVISFPSSVPTLSQRHTLY